MTEEQASALLSQLEQIEKGVQRDIARVKAEIRALRRNVAIEAKQPEGHKSTQLEERRARIMASYK
ncbi:hypothetical protein [Chryseobacterium sp. 2VB]|uniref:hypothetical protein n=1 Tax=Chryseobacterium sp. 2VB TaxID=2502204 RepID=UPI0010F7CF90|nr:hypothetical protein [Chryseobacterium sp. 2VB]